MKREKHEEFDFFDHFHLTMMLDVAVPLWLENVRGWSDARKLSTASRAGQTLGSHGQALMFRTPAKKVRKTSDVATSQRPPGTAEMFNILARGIACAVSLGGDYSEIRRLLLGAISPSKQQQRDSDRRIWNKERIQKRAALERASEHRKRDMGVKAMTFEDALRNLKQGLRIRRAGWPENWSGVSLGGIADGGQWVSDVRNVFRMENLDFGGEAWHFSFEDIMADDWVAA